MAKPKYEYKILENKQFVNPYNFIQKKLSEINRVNIDETKEGTLHTGVLNCKLITRTPLAVPDDYKEELIQDVKGKQLLHKKYPFFNYGDGMPVIPGSALRGVVRSVYEAATDSCYSTADEDAAITVRSVKPFSPGLLIRNDKNNKWELYEADRYKIGVRESSADNVGGRTTRYKIVNRNELKKYGFGRKVRFSGYTSKVSKFADEFSVDMKSKLPNEGYLYVGEPFKNKKYEGIFCKKSEEKLTSYELDDKKILGLDQIKDMYNDEKINYNLKKNKGELYAGYEAAKDAGVIPLWYRKGNKNNEYYLSLASIGRMAYSNTMGDLLGEKEPCTRRSAVCKACALFGMASGEESLGGRVRITDAYTNMPKDKWDMGYHTLKELAGPKTSYLPFYASNNDGNCYSYDEPEATIRGRKFYWHNEASDAFETNERTERNSTMQLVDKGVEFEFKVYFNDITDTQLEELKWALTFGENTPDSSLCYKIGHGKPIGLGSAKIVIDSCMERNTSRGYTVSECTDVRVDKGIFANTSVEELLIIADMESVKGKDVRYPYINNPNNVGGVNDTASHKWFSTNYSLGNKTVKQDWVSISDIAEKSLYAYDIREKLNDESGKGRPQGGKSYGSKPYGGKFYGGKSQGGK